MANYFATKTAQFKPFSYQEMLAPIMALKEDYEKTEKELSDLEELAATQAFTFQGSSYEDTYNNYIKSLNNVSENISIGNYNSDTKRQIKDLRKQFLNTLAPAAQRITKLNTLRDKQNAEQANNPYIRFSTDYRNVNEKDITANSNYTSYDLSKIYKQIAEDTLNRIATDYRPQVGNPVNIKGTNSYIVKHGYGMTPEEYKSAIDNPNSDLNKYINSEINKAVKGITNDDVIKEVTQGVKDIIKSNIGKFESTTVKSSNNSESNANFFRAAENAYKYKWEKDANGNLIITGLSDEYKLDHGYTRNTDGTWNAPSYKNQPTYESGPLNPVVLKADDLTQMLGKQSFWKSRAAEVEQSKELDAVIKKPNITISKGNQTYTGKQINVNTDLRDNSFIKNWIKETVGENNINNYMYLYNEDDVEIYILPADQHKVNTRNNQSYNTNNSSIIHSQSKTEGDDSEDTI